jgi:hypothetical protein
MDSTFLSILGVAAIGANFIAVGIHTGTILLFEVTSGQPNFLCQLVDSQRCHTVATTDLASTTTSASEVYILFNQIIIDICNFSLILSKDFSFFG